MRQGAEGRGRRMYHGAIARYFGQPARPVMAIRYAGKQAINKWRAGLYLGELWLSLAISLLRVATHLQRPPHPCALFPTLGSLRRQGSRRPRAVRADSFATG